MPAFSICAPAGHLSSLLSELTNSQTPPRKLPLSLECGVIILCRTLRALYHSRVDSLAELAARREAAAVLQILRMDIERGRSRS